jgi:outer membrane protein insertion porin family
MAGARHRTSPRLGNARPLGVALALPFLGLALLGAGEARAGETAADPPAAAAAAPAAEPSLAQAGSPELTPPADAPDPGPLTPSGAPPGDPLTPQEPPAEAAPASPASGEAPAAEPFAPADATPVAPAEAPSLAPQPEAPEPRVRISTIVVEGLENHPERERIEQAAYGAITVVPGTEVTRSDLRKDLAAVYATGWFSDVRMRPVDTSQGVRLVVTVVPNPTLTKVVLDPPDVKLPASVVEDTFAGDYGRTINLNTIKTRTAELQKWYADQGFSLARITGPARVGPDGEVQISVRQGVVEGVEVEFLNKEGSATNDKGEPIRGKTKLWVVTREISLAPGDVFNRRNLEEDLKRLYGTGLFSDVKVTLRPVAEDPGRVTIVLGVVEQSTGSISGGLGYSQSQGVFGQLQLQDTNLFGRAWDLSTSFTYGQFGGLFDVSFTDPWIKGDRYRTALRVKAYISREVPQVFRSDDNGDILTVSDFYKAPGTNIAYNIDSNNNPEGEDFNSVDEARDANDDVSWLDYDGNSVVIQRFGGNFQLVRPLNGGDPFKRATWSVLAGLTAQQVRPINFAGESRPYGVVNDDFNDGGDQVPTDSVICISYNCADTNVLVGVRLAATRNTLDDPRNPTSGSFFTIGTEQFLSVGEDSPTFNRLRATYTRYYPVRWLKIFKGCRPKPGEEENCKQALAFHLSAGTNIGDLPPYEAFCIGGGNSVRGYPDCDLGVGRSFGEATIEYRFPVFSIVSGEVFVDGGTAFGSQGDVEGKPGELLDKPGDGFSVGTGLIVTTPVGPLRLEVASRDFSGDWRFNLGVGWKF